MYFYNLGQSFLDVVENHAPQTALHFKEGSHSFEELNHWAENLACILHAKGCRQGDVIAIGHDKQPLSYALMLAGLKLGVTYVNIDVVSPLERNARILKVSGARFLFYDSSEYTQVMTDLSEKSGCELLMLDEKLFFKISEDDLEQQKNLISKVDGSCIAYIMFTSGSTGIPKGVAVTHQNVLHFIQWGQQCFNIGPGENFANLSPMYFDNSVFDFYVALFSGASLTPVPRHFLTKPYELVSFVGELGCTMWFSVPSLLIYLFTMKAYTIEALPKLRHIVFGGEGYPKTELKKLFDRFGQQAKLVNVYGPTECTCICSAHTISEHDFSDMEGLPTLGQLNPNFDFKILNENNELDDSGELCLIGPNVAAGYFGDETLTNASFEVLSDKNRFMKRMYRTGDLVKKINENLYFVGRIDNQIKHMGYRIELEEIEAAVYQLPGVVQTAVIYKRVKSAFGKIYCFVKSDKEFDGDEAIQKLKKYLPEYMLPSKIILMDELPKNPNGKIDRTFLTNFEV